MVLFIPLAAGSNAAELPETIHRLNTTGHVIETITPSHDTITYLRDPSNRLTGIRAPDLSIDYKLMSDGHLTKVRDATGETKIETAKDGTALSVTRPEGQALLYWFTQDGLLSTLFYGGEILARYDRDSFDRVTTINSAAGRFRISFDPGAGRETRLAPNGVLSVTERDAFGRVVVLTHSNASAALLLQLTYSYDAAGRIARIIEEIGTTTQDDPQSERVKITYRHDAFGQLQRVDYADGRALRFRYDQRGNRIRGTFDLTDQSMAHTATYDDLDKLLTHDGLSVEHDPADRIAKLGDHRFRYDSLGRHIATGNVQFAWNGLGWRIAEEADQGRQTFIRSLLGAPVLLAEEGFRPRRYIWSGAHPLAEVDENGVSRYYLHDILGTVRAVVDAHGQVIGRCNYGPFGSDIAVSKTCPRFGFAGMERAADGTLFTPARTYVPSLGRFTSKDPIPPDPLSPSVANPYVYVDNRPLRFRDTTGLQAEPVQTMDDVITLLDELERTRTFPEVSADTFLLPDLLADLVIVSPINLILQADGEIARAVEQEFRPSTSLVPYFRSKQILQRYPVLYGLAPGSETDLTKRIFQEKNKDGYFYKRSLPVGESLSDNLSDQKARRRYGDIADPEWYAAHRYLHGPALLWSYIRQPFEDVAYFGKAILKHPDLPWTRPGEYEAQRQANRENKLGRYLGRRDAKRLTLEAAGIASQDAIRIFSNGMKLFIDGIATFAGGAAKRILQGSVAEAAEIHTLDRGLIDPPDVGGVLLDVVAVEMTEFGGIDGVTIDPVSGTLRLFGPSKKDGVEAQIDPTLISDAVRIVYDANPEPAGVTIDPNPIDPDGPEMVVRYFGSTEGTRAGLIMFEADRIMKSLSLGRDTLTGQPMIAPMNGFRTLLELGEDDLQTSRERLWSRFWLVPDPVPVMASPDGQRIAFPETRIRVRTETMVLTNGVLSTAEGHRDPAAEAFATHFTKNYDSYAQAYPVFAELKALVNAVALLRWVKDRGIPINWDALHFEPPEFARAKTPESTPAMTVSALSQTQSGNQVQTITRSIYGGVDLGFDLVETPDDGRLRPLTIPSADRVAITIPIGVQVPGALSVRAHELGLVDRVTRSVENRPGPFGPGWRLAIPTLAITSPNDGESHHLTWGEKSVERRIYRLRDPFGKTLATFRDHHLDQTIGEIVVLADNAVYPASPLLIPRSDGMLELRHSDGVSVYNSAGQLVMRKTSDGIRTTLTYSGEPSPTEVIETLTDGQTKRLQLKSKRGRITEAILDGLKIGYGYDALGRLITMTQDGETTTYSYDLANRLIGVVEPRHASLTLNYDRFGRDANLTIAPRSDNSTSVIRHEDGTESHFDALGYLADIRADDGGQVAIIRDAAGNPIALEITNARNQNARIERDGPDQLVLHVDGAVSARAKRQIDGSFALVTPASAKTEPAGFPSAKPAQSAPELGPRISIRREGQDVHVQLPDTGQTEFSLTKGQLTDFKSGRLRVSLTYGQNGRLRSINGKNHELSITGVGRDKVDVKYHVTINDPERSTSQFEETLRIGSNGPIGRRSSNGLDDEFTYDQSGALIDVRRRGSANWQIDRPDAQTETVRKNGVPLYSRRFIPATQMVIVQY